MKVNLKVLEQLHDVFLVTTMSSTSRLGIERGIKTGAFRRAPASYEAFIIEAGYKWSDGKTSYVMEDQSVYYIHSAKAFSWVWDNTFFRTFGAVSDVGRLNKWLNGNEKYPEGKANHFIGLYKQMTGQDEGDEGKGGIAVAWPDEDGGKNTGEYDIDIDRSKGGGDVNFDGTGVRQEDPKPVDPTDALIAKLAKQAGSKKTLPADVIIDIGLKARKEKDEKLLKFLRTIKPMNESFIKKSTLQEVIRQIVKGIVKERSQNEDVSGQSETGGVYPVAGKPNLSKKKILDISINDEEPSNFTPKQKQSLIAYYKQNLNTDFEDLAKHLSKVLGKSITSKELYSICVDGLFGGNVKDTGGETIDEMTTTSGGGGSSAGTPGYNVPGAFSRKGGSKAGVEGSRKLGYELTPVGKKDMEMPADKLYEGKAEKCPKCNGTGEDPKQIGKDPFKCCPLCKGGGKSTPKK